ncbi:MAG TPA: double-strand break repair protein AddB [Rhodobacteraceae bacterium]|jgi:ATP-dependent helicase/nuclease subunit B|nr:double-strand break repair protein AddB [Paracoccaceae bacterium]HBV54272.1 double-strand break repair protein AddB [Paracoccaceae bacterium]
MFEPQPKPRVFGVPPGADFPRALVAHLTDAYRHQPPQALARVRIIVNTRRMERRIREMFDAGPALLLPRIELVAEMDAAFPDLPAATSPLRRRLELTRLIARLLDAEPDLAARASLYDLADSLAALIDEMHGEGISPDVVAQIDVANHSAHWARTQSFLGIAAAYLEAMNETPDSRERQRLAVDAILADWASHPPTDPVILAGSTGSWTTTRRLMCAIARLPQGAVILPGFDNTMPASAWADLDDRLTAEDHPQSRFRRLMEELDLTRNDILDWPNVTAPNPARNALVSLALRPAPVTDCWLTEGPHLPNLLEATEQVTLLEAPTRRLEAFAIALRLRKAAEDGQSAALITPDRMLTRQVTAHLDRWRILPDDSAGEPLHLTAPGRFLRHTAALTQDRLTAEMLLVVLKHPLCQSGGDRKRHLRYTRLLELHIRRNGMPYPDAPALRLWGNAKSPEALEWVEWLLACLEPTPMPHPDLTQRVHHHLALTEALAGGPTALWDGDAGTTALRVMSGLLAEAPHGDALSPHDYSDLITALLMRETSRSAVEPHPLIRIWGTLEARVQGADLLILGGLNDGIWPAAVPPDPWMNRAMRLAAGLRLPEVRIGLAAHDFQQAVGAPEVWLTRSLRADDAQSVPSRWLNRLTNLLDGLPHTHGRAALKLMRAKGKDWLALAAELDKVAPAPPTQRPSPVPPAGVQPTTLSVTQIKTLIRDPYAIYARRILNLRPLDPLMQSPDARLKGTALHEAFERFLRAVEADASQLTVETLLDETETVLAENVPWPEVQMLWHARVRRIAKDFIAEEIARQSIATPAAFEAKGSVDLPEFGLTLSGTADRIDRAPDGSVLIYDYKTGTPPTEKQQVLFDRQLQIEAAMIRAGSFQTIGPTDVSSAAFLGVGATLKTVSAPLTEKDGTDFIDQTWAWLRDILEFYLVKNGGYTARKQMELASHAGDYDHLARYGEWDETQPAHPEQLK